MARGFLVKFYRTSMLNSNTLIFVLREKGGKTKKRMKEEEIEKGDCGQRQPEKSLIWRLSGILRRWIYFSSKLQTGNVMKSRFLVDYLELFAPIGQLDLCSKLFSVLVHNFGGRWRSSVVTAIVFALGGSNFQIDNGYIPAYIMKMSYLWETGLNTTVIFKVFIYQLQTFVQLVLKRFHPKRKT